MQMTILSIVQLHCHICINLFKNIYFINQYLLELFYEINICLRFELARVYYNRLKIKVSHPFDKHRIISLRLTFFIQLAKSERF